MKTGAFIILFIEVCWYNAALASICEPGYYPVNGTCTICPTHHACPDGDTIISCSSGSKENAGQYTNGPGATACLDCPTTILHPEGFEGWWSAGYAGLANCRAQWERRTEHGTISFSCSAYGSGYYDNTENRDNKCMLDTSSCDAGYVSAIPKNIHGDYRTWVNSYPEANDFEVCAPAGIGSYSADGDIVPIACPPGTSTHTELASSVDECLPLCTGGITKFRVGKYSFNLWKNKYTTPTLNVRTPDGTVCYLNLESGTATATLNIRVGDKTYHVTN